MNNLPQGENIEIEVDNQNLKIKSGHSKAIIKGLLAEDFPLLPKKSAEYMLNIPSLRLKGIISRLITCVAINESRQELSGVNVILKEKEILFASTDSFRLIENKMILEGGMTESGYGEFIERKNNLIVPANTLIELARIIPNEVESEIRIAIEEGQIFFEIEGQRERARQPSAVQILRRENAIELLQTGDGKAGGIGR